MSDETANASDEDEDNSLDYSHVFPDFTIDHIHDMKFQKTEKNDGDSVSCASTDLPTSMAPSKRSSRLSSSFNSSISAGSGRKNIWSDMTKRGYMLTTKDAYGNEDEEDAYNDLSRRGLCKAFLCGCIFEAKYVIKTFCKYPYIIVYSLLVFAALTAAGLTIIQVIARNHRQSLAFAAECEARDTATWFSDTFTETLIPLRSLQQAVIYSEYFKDLPHQIGNLPLVLGPNGLNDYRNVTGICDNEIMYEQFRSIVKTINKNFNTDGIIVNYRLAPYGVFCLIDPLVNTVDFSEENPMVSTGAIGWDPIVSNGRWQALLPKVYADNNKVNIFGPMYDYVETGNEFFCVHLAVNIPGYNYTLGDQTISTWGFVMAFIKWSTVMERSGMNSRFVRKAMSYRLTRTDSILDSVTGEMVDNVSSRNISTLHRCDS